MSYTVNVTSTTTTSNNAIALNYGYFKTIPGILKLAELILGIITVSITASHYNRVASAFLFGNGDLFFFLMATTFLIATFCLLLSYVISWGTASLISKTMFELVYHAVATILLLASSIFFLVKIVDSQTYYSSRQTYDAYMASSVIGLMNAVLYLASTIFAQRQYRGI